MGKSEIFILFSRVFVQVLILLNLSILKYKEIDVNLQFIIGSSPVLSTTNLTLPQYFQYKPLLLSASTVSNTLNYSSCFL